MYKKNLGHYMPKQSSAMWVTDILETCVLEVSVHDTIWGIHWSSGSQTFGHVSLIAITRFNVVSPP
jgi:hypothetical protein